MFVSYRCSGYRSRGNNFILLSRDQFCLLVLARFLKWTLLFYFFFSFLPLILAPVCSPTPTLASHLVSESVCWLPRFPQAMKPPGWHGLLFHFGLWLLLFFSYFIPSCLCFLVLYHAEFFSVARAHKENNTTETVFSAKLVKTIVYIERKKRAHLMLSPGVVINTYLLHRCLDTSRPCPWTVKTRGRRQLWMTLWWPWPLCLGLYGYSRPSSALLQGSRSVSWPSLLWTSWAAPSLVSCVPQSISSSPPGADPAVVLCIYNQDAWSFMLVDADIVPPRRLHATSWELRESRRSMLTMEGAEPNSDLFLPHLDVSPCVPAGGMWWRMDSDSK